MKNLATNTWNPLLQEHVSVLLVPLLSPWKRTNCRNSGWRNSDLWIGRPWNLSFTKERTYARVPCEIAHLRPRTNTFGAVFAFVTMAMAVSRFFTNVDFYFHTPIITASTVKRRSDVSGNYNEPFMIEKDEIWFNWLFQWFLENRQVFTVSGQLEGELAIAMSMGRFIHSVQLFVPKTRILHVTFLNFG